MIPYWWMNSAFVDRSTWVVFQWILGCSQRDWLVKSVVSSIDISKCIVSIIQFADVNPTKHLLDSHQGISGLCSSMDIIADNPMASLGRWIRFVYNVDVGACSNYDYAGFIQQTSNANWSGSGTSSGSSFSIEMSRRRRLHFNFSIIYSSANLIPSMQPDWAIEGNN